MGDRYVVSAASTSDLRRLAHAARALVGDAGTVEAVALVGEAGMLCPECESLEQLATGLGGLADRLIAYEGAGSWLRGDRWAVALLDAVGDAADGVFVADAAAAREAVARVAAIRGASCVTMCDAVTRGEGDSLVATRSVYGGVADGAIALFNKPAVCLFAAGKFEGEANGTAALIERRPLAPPSYDLALKDAEPVTKTVDLGGACVVVSVGRGFAKGEDIDLVRPLVDRLGAELGCSRPIAEDFKWLSQERLVGLTGTSVNADLYLAIGISGQVQHLAGIKGAKVVVAVNNDRKAPIVRNADYVLLSDLYEAIPELLAALGSAS